MGASALVDIHPSLWLGSQLARARTNVVPCGFDILAPELPGEGWPKGTLTDLLVQQPGVGELRLLLPALRVVEWSLREG